MTKGFQDHARNIKEEAKYANPNDSRYFTGICLTYTLLIPPDVIGEVRGVAPGIPESTHRNVIIQLFNWPFVEVQRVLPELKARGYSHVHVSPPQLSNERVWQWWGRYQPIDFTLLRGPLGNELEFKQLNDAADQVGIQIVADVVLNHTVDLAELPEQDFVVMDAQNKKIIQEKFSQFDPQDFHARCPIQDSVISTVRQCWLSNNLADLKTEDPHVRQVAQAYLHKLVGFGVDGFRFDAAKHIEPEFFAAVLAPFPHNYAFGEIIESSANKFPDIPSLDFYDFPLVAAMKQAFQFGGNLANLKEAAQHNQALPGPKAVTFVRNHDLDRGQAGDRGVDDSSFGVGWDQGTRSLNRTDVNLAYAFVFGREDGLPYVFADMPTLPIE